MMKVKMQDAGDTVTIKIQLVKKLFACIDCKYFGVSKESEGRRQGWCSLKHSATREVALDCQPKKGWKKQ